MRPIMCHGFSNTDGNSEINADNNLDIIADNNLEVNMDIGIHLCR